MTPVNCVICKGSIQCNRCTITQLRQENQALKKELSTYYIDKSELLQLKYYEELQLRKYIQQSASPYEFEYKDKLSNAHFITLTFDPAKFGLQEYRSQRMDYISYQLTSLLQQQLTTSFYGCFENHKNGIIHAHLIMITAFPKEVFKQLKKSLTDNQYNKVCVDIGPAKYPQAKEYIEKESTDYFKSKEQPIVTKPCSLMKCLKPSIPTNEPNPLDAGI